MPHDQSYQAIIIKKQAFDEADEIVTFFTKEKGKLRALAKSLRLPKSKLQHALQPLFLVNVTIAGSSGLSKIIHCNIVQAYSKIHEDEQRVKFWYVAAELCLKALPDEQPNEKLFDLYLDYLEFLNIAENTELLTTGLIKFKLSFCTLLGFGFNYDLNVQGPLFFSNENGFSNSSLAGLQIDPSLLVMAKQIQSMDFHQLNLIAKDAGSKLDSLLSSFISYQLEREIKSEKYLGQ